MYSDDDTHCWVGFPIRKFTDQSLFAAPRNLSQRTTSFIASRRQGIHRMPLRHLITLIVDARQARRPNGLDRRKDQFLRDLPDCRRLSRQALELLGHPLRDNPRTNLLFTMSEQQAARDSARQQTFVFAERVNPND